MATVMTAATVPTPPSVPSTWAKWAKGMRSPMGIVALSMLAVLILVAALAPFLLGDAADERNTALINHGPTAADWVGTDGLGRDIFLRVLVATRLSLLLALATTAIAVLGGLLLGALPSILGRRVGRLIVAIVDLTLAFPGLLVVLLVATIIGIGARGAVLALGFATVPAFARLVHTNAAAISGRDFVAAARTVGVGRVPMVYRHVLPNIAEPLVVAATLVMSGALLAFGGLSFLGLGVQAPSYDWGRLLDEGLDRIYVNPWAAVAPAAPMVFAGLTFALLGEAAAKVVGAETSIGRALRRTVPRSSVRPASGPLGGEAIVVARDLRVSFPTPTGWVHAVDGIDLTIRAGEAVGVVGESGSGKSLTALAIAALTPDTAVVTAAQLEFRGMPMLGGKPGELRRRLGTDVAMIFQDPATSFNPSMKVGNQLAEVGRAHLGLGRTAAFARAVDRLRLVRIPAPERRARQYPHEFSGGMSQRAMVGLGLMGSPKLIIADEPTTALDVTVQRHILQLIAEARASSQAAVLFISHDIAVVSQLCDRFVVMYAGRIVEDLPMASWAEAAHPYTRALLGAVPDMTTSRDEPLATIAGRPPALAERPAGCPFAPRCGRADARCSIMPPLAAVAPHHLSHHLSHHLAACWHPVTS